MQRILKHCFVNVIFLYGVFSLTAEIFFSYLPYGLILVLTLYLLIQIIRIPAPHEYCVETIVGQDLWLEAEESDDSLFLLKTVAHRGAALDAPENSLEAFKQVLLKNEVIFVNKLKSSFCCSVQKKVVYLLNLMLP